MTDTTTRIAIYAANENIATQINTLGFVARTMADGSILAEDASRECGGGISTLLFGCACGPGLVTIPEVAGWYLETMNAHRVEWFEADTEGAGFTEDFNMEIAKAETIAADLNAAHAALWAAHEAIGGGPSVTARDLRRVGDLLYAMAATWSVAGDALRDGDIQSVDQVADTLIGYGLNGETVITRRALDAMGGL